MTLGGLSLAGGGVADGDGPVLPLLDDGRPVGVRVPVVEADEGDGEESEAVERERRAIFKLLEDGGGVYDEYEDEDDEGAKGREKLWKGGATRPAPLPLLAPSSAGLAELGLLWPPEKLRSLDVE